MNSMIMVLAMSAGQSPAPTIPVQGTPVAAQPAPMPGATQLPATQPPANGNGKANGNGNGCEPCEEKKDEPPEPWALMRVLKGTTFGDAMEAHGISISGWTEGNYTYGNRGPSNLPVTFNNRRDFWQMNQNLLRIDKAIDTSKSEFQWGGRAEFILPGTDAQFTPSRGLLDNQTGDYRIDMIQGYIDTYYPNLGPQGTTFRVGKFATHCSYELMQGAETPFLSRSYMFQYNPFTHTGGYAITPLNDTWTVSNGLVLGSDNFIGAPAKLTYIGQLKWAPKEGKTSALLNLVVTDPTFDVANNFAFYNYYGLLVSHKFTEKFTGVVDAAFANMDGVPNVGTTNWYGAAAYGIYQFNDKLAATLRAELFEDTQGVRTGYKGLYNETTFGLAWSPTRSLIIRPAVRYDYNADSRPWDGKRDLLTAAMDVIIRW